jgi:hypothetical protein
MEIRLSTEESAEDSEEALDVAQYKVVNEIEAIEAQRTNA